MPVWCPKCNAILPDGTKKCPVCGAKISGSNNPSELSREETRAIFIYIMGIAAIPIVIGILLALICYLGSR